MSVELSDLEVGPNTGFSKADAASFGLLIEMAYKMSGQGLDPPLPPDFPSKEFEVIRNVTMVDSVLGTGGTRVFYGFIARSKVLRTNNYVLVIRGTLGIVEWIIDLKSIYAIPFHGHGEVGSGFADTYATLLLHHRGATIVKSAAEMDAEAASRPFAKQVAEALEEDLATTGSTNPGLPAPRLWLTGHSLGSALITLYAVHRLVWPTIPISKCYTFASPLVGDRAFKDAFDSVKIGDAYRIFDDWDPVPDLPALVGFTPVGVAEEFSLDLNFLYPFNPACSHSMDTYLNHFDSNQQPAYACNHLFMSLAARTAPAATGAAETVSLAAVPEAATGTEAVTHTTSISHAQTTVTITVRTSRG